MAKCEIYTREAEDLYKSQSQIMEEIEDLQRSLQEEATIMQPPSKKVPDVQTLPEEVTNTQLLQREATTTAPKRQATNPAANKERTTITGKVYKNLKSVPQYIHKLIRQLIRNGITRYDQQRVELI